MMTLGQMSGYVLATGVDSTGLGRWSWILHGAGEGNDLRKTRVVVAYQPCEPGKNSKGKTTFEQHQQYFEQKGDFWSPRTIFYEQLFAQLKA